MRKMKNLGLDGKKTISGFLKAEGQFFDIFFFICPRQLNNWHCMSLLWDFLRHFFDLNYFILTESYVAEKLEKWVSDWIHEDSFQ